MSEPIPTPKPNATIPDHELIRPIGRGSYGEVWLARSVLGEFRAVKIVRRDSFDRDRPVERELEGIQKYEPISRSHEHQVHILHVGRFAEGFYYVMELADDASAPVASEVTRLVSEAGPRQSLFTSAATYSPKTLRSEVRLRGRLSVNECIDLALKLTDALAHLHGHGLVHRDLKPSNLIFVRGQPKLADVGLVATADSTLSCVGTEGFLPPEGQGKPQADLFALGKVLYEISTGRDRHDFPELPTMLRDDPQRRALEEFNEVILKACDPDVRRRYATARAMHADLELLRAGRSLQQVHRRERRNAGARKVAAMAALAAVVISLASLWWPRPREASRPLPARLTVDGAEFWRFPWMARQFDFSPDGERIVFGGTIRPSIWERKTGTTRPLRLSGVTNWWPAGPSGASAMPRWAPDSRQFVFQAHQMRGGTQDEPVLAYGLFVVNSDTGEARQVGPNLTETNRATDVCWRPDGEALTYVTRHSRLVTLSLNGAQTVWKDSSLPGAHGVSLGGYSPDGAWLLLSTDNGGFTAIEDRDVWALPHLGGPGKRLTQSPGVDAFPVWSPDGESVYYVSDGGRKGTDTWGIWKLRIDRKTKLPTGASAEVLTRNGLKLFHPKFAADGRVLMYAGQEPNTRIWVADVTAMDKATEVVRGQDAELAPDGQTVYFIGETPDQQGVYAISRSGARSSLRTVTDLKASSHSLSVSPDGQWLALSGYNGKQFGVFVVPSAGGDRQLVEELAAGDVIKPVWSPDGRWIAYALGPQLVRVSRDGQVREPLATLHLWWNETIRWSPDGQHLAAFANATANGTYESRGIYLVSVADKTWKKLSPENENREKEGLEWHPSGEYLTYMFYGPEKTGAQIRRAYPDGRPTDVMFDQPDHWDYVGVWAPDGQQFFFISFGDKPGDKRIHLFDTQTRQITHGLRDGSLPSWSRDGRVAVWATEETLRYFEMVEGFR